MKTKIEGKVALVTGSNRGIGRALVEGLLKRGASKVYATARNTDSLKSLMESNSDQVVPVSLDVTQVDQVAHVASLAGDVQIVINNAGYAAQTDLFADDLSAARQEHEVNYWGALNVARAFVPIVEGNGGGALINIGSMASLVNFPPFPTYSDSKAAVHSLTQGLRLTRGKNIQVVGVYPGPVDTDMAAGLQMDKATPESVSDAILDGMEAGKEDIFPDPVAVGFMEPYEAGAKTLERGTAEMLAGSA
ncbi:MAG: SDR family oxidoreductase [Verrucomicrobia bacterium]|nr:SDR family oxidoreductase [Verrucomicrobiota bacterium]MDA1067197.1 SDR family oxidoreductase [Verrucomicrobiota bacterium]